MEKFNISEHTKELTFDEVIEYKGIFFTPVEVYMYDEFYTYINCMLYDKNSIPDIKILQMSYLDFLFYLDESGDNKYILFLLASLISLCTNVKIEDVKYYRNEKNKCVLVLNGIEFNHKEFLIIREIICSQNNIDLSIFDLDPRVREEIQKTMDLQSKESTFNVGTLEEQMICCMITSGLNQEEVKKLSLRKFRKILDRVDAKMNYEICMTASMSGMVEFKGDIPHWMNTLEKGKFDKFISSYEEVENKVKMSNSGV